jgi:glycosyltransferase involved in cell wall biosynthesis
VATHDISVIILTFNEEIHIERCLNSLKSFAKNVFIVDSFSTDRTVELCSELGAQVFQNPFKNHAAQFNWGLAHCPITTDWVMRLDADEYVLPELAEELQKKLQGLPETVAGIYVKRRVFFHGRWIRHGGYYPVWLLRVWRHGKAVCEGRLMDEHIKLSEGEAIKFTGDIVDENLHGLTAWTNKHNGYATKEAIELLNITHSFLNYSEVSPRLFGTQEQRKRWLKTIYARLPLFVRPLSYFLYRYVVKRGFLDGREGLIWHFLQGFWYRFLVDAKLLELKRAMHILQIGPQEAILKLYGIEVGQVRQEPGVSHNN